jgi:hypothetical protein
MLERQKVIAALEEKRAQFESFRQLQVAQNDLAEAKLAAFLELSAAQIEQIVADRAIEWPGALPIDELDQAVEFRLPFRHVWQSHEQARAWALTVLQGRIVGAVDGSQLAPSKELSIPVGAVQVGWYVNYHVPGGRYEKDVSFEVLAPQELSDGDVGDGEFPDWRINQRRFVGECAALETLLTRHASGSAAGSPLFFFDGSLVVSFVGQLRPERGAPYLQALRSLLVTSAELRAPVAGFVDSSASRDVVTLVNHVTGPPYMSLADGALLAPLLPDWGDRSPFFVCARSDILSTQGRADFYRDVAFCYLRLAVERPPARVEIPLWAVEAGLAEELVDLVRAQCIVGTGYPYVIETADAVAVIQQADRERFYGILQQFAERAELPYTISRKSLSKQTRR